MMISLHPEVRAGPKGGQMGKSLQGWHQTQIESSFCSDILLLLTRGKLVCIFIYCKKQEQKYL
jgi:hypothetical protein